MKLAILGKEQDGKVHLTVEEIKKMIEDAYDRIRITGHENVIYLSMDSPFGSDFALTDIYVPWAEGAISGAPWGATNATVHYNTVFDSEGNIIS